MNAKQFVGQLRKLSNHQIRIQIEMNSSFKELDVTLPSNIVDTIHTYASSMIAAGRLRQSLAGTDQKYGPCEVHLYWLEHGEKRVISYVIVVPGLTGNDNSVAAAFSFETGLHLFETLTGDDAKEESGMLFDFEVLEQLQKKVHSKLVQIANDKFDPDWVE